VLRRRQTEHGADWTGLDSQSWDSRHAVLSCEVNGQLPVCIASISRLMTVHSEALLQQQPR